MKKQFISTASGMMLVAALLFAAAPATARTANPRPQDTPHVAVDNDKLEDTIEKAWKADPKLSGLKLDVAVDNGVATVSGDVRTAAQKSRAEKLAHIPGVTSVKSELKINPDARSTVEKAGDKTKSGLETAANKSGEAVGTAAEKTKEAAGKSADVASDTWITTKVKSKFVGEKTLKGSDITVTTDNGVVTLTGTVPSEAAHTRAIAVAKGTKGTKEVVDKLTVTGGTH